MNIKETRQNQVELRQSLKELVNNLSSKCKNVDDVFSNECVSVADVIFETYDTKLTQSYFIFLRNAKSLDMSKRNKNSSYRNTTTREMIF